MQRNYKIGLVIVAVALPLLLTSWGRLVLFGLLGIVFLPVWALLLASVFFIICIVLGSIIVAVSNAVAGREPPAVQDVKVVVEDHKRAA